MSSLQGGVRRQNVPTIDMMQNLTAPGGFKCSESVVGIGKNTLYAYHRHHRFSPKQLFHKHNMRN
jgi:hypothetical protein